jgi:TldD protein
MTENQVLFFRKFGITHADLQRYLAEALSAGGDYADLYFEYLTSTSITVDESIVKSASQGISAGCGVRVLAGERTGYAYTDDLAPEKILRAARTAALIARGPSQQPIQGQSQSSALPGVFAFCGCRYCRQAGFTPARGQGRPRI